MASKAKTATRASTRTKTPTGTVPAATRVTRATTASKMKSTDVPTKPAPRKALVNRDNSPDLKPASKSSQKPPLAKTASLATIVDDDDEREPIKAFLRIRPHLGEDEPSATPYLDPISDTTVRMQDPSSSSQSQAYSRMSTVNPSSLYTFSHIFPPSTQQPQFFQKTTLPLVKDVLEGQSALLFAYGVTNSGKTYTIQGGNNEGSAGILPRTLDVIFNSIEGLHGDGRYRPVRLQGIELATEPASSPNTPARRAGPSLADILEDQMTDDIDIDPTTLTLDRNYEYTIWLSYSEVYNEKVYDLFASVDDPTSEPQPTMSGIPRPTSSFLNLPLPSSQSHPLLLTRKALPVKPCPPSDTDSSSSDMSSTGKYIAGLRQIRVHNAAEAKTLLKLGQLHRRVFGTVANSQSSRSHALVTIKVLRVHRGERNDPTSIQTSRLTLVDLAGSERTKHTHTSGERLREAGNINKSLMVLGQCMETMRANQRAVARSLAGGLGSQRMDTRDVKKGLAVVPFRHSKLTEVLMDYFVGEGRAVMIVNVNPYDTGYDENSHVMKFAALAREVCTTAPTAVPRALPKAKPGQKKSIVEPQRRTVSISLKNGKKTKETLLEVLEEDEDQEGDTDVELEDEPINPLVDALFDEIEQLRIQLFESEMRSAIIEAEIREEVMSEMEERMRMMEARHAKLLLREVERNEMKMDAKIDMLQKSAMKPKGTSRRVYESETEEEEIDISLKDDEMDVDSESEASRSPSPLATKGKGVQKTTKFQPFSSSADEYEDEISEDEDEPVRDYEHESEIEECTPAKNKSSKNPPEFLTSPPPLIFEADVKAAQKGKNTLKSSKQSEGLGSLTKELNLLSLQKGSKKTRTSTKKASEVAEEGERQLRRSTRAKS
ncbi:unnamed protein product [Somion occarium]|uniref:Kinesin-like protein n=1 Tax=Somion occarium TaxID=3059160 RepID=A0ABP1CNG1_9APHY